MRKFLLCSVLFMLLTSFSFNSYSKNLKIGYVDIFEVFNEYEKTKAYDKNLEEKKGKKEKEFDKKKQELEEMQNKLSLLKDEEQKKEQEKFAKKVKDLRELERTIFTDLKNERDEKMKEIINDINKVVENYAKKQGFDLIVNENALLYGNKVMDITPQILRLVNERYKR